MVKGNPAQLLPDAPSAAALLRSAPAPNHTLRVEARPGGGVLASVPIRRPRYLVPPISWILPFSAWRRVELDALGAEVLRHCDGNRTVEAIVEAFASAHKLSFREAQLPVMQFLQQLTRRGLVVIVGPRKK